MDTYSSLDGWWWLDENHHWRFSRSRVVAVVRARRARRAELEGRLAERGVIGGRWR